MRADLRPGDARREPRAQGQFARCPHCPARLVFDTDALGRMIERCPAGHVRQLVRPAPVAPRQACPGCGGPQLTARTDYCSDVCRRQYGERQRRRRAAAL